MTKEIAACCMAAVVLSGAVNLADKGLQPKEAGKESICAVVPEEEVIAEEKEEVTEDQEGEAVLSAEAPETSAAEQSVKTQSVATQSAVSSAPSTSQVQEPQTQEPQAQVPQVQVSQIQVPQAQAPVYEESYTEDPAYYGSEQEWTAYEGQDYQEPVYQETWVDPAYEEQTWVEEQPSYNQTYTPLTASAGVTQGPSGKETYYNLPMGGVVNIMRGMGNGDEYWVRDDGVKMLGDYVIVAANLDTHPRGSLVETSLGTGIVCDTGGFAYSDPYQIDVATAW